MVPRLLKELWTFKRSIIFLLTPILLCPLPILVPTRPAKCGYVIMIMAVYWMTEVIPMAVTALLPLVLMPPLGVMGAKDLSLNYLKDTNMLFVGGLIVAVAVEKWNLHKRIALRVLMLVGSQPKWLMFGFMVTTAFLSMWISNTATTAMMVPIVQAVLSELDIHRKKNRGKVEGAFDNAAFQEDTVNQEGTEMDNHMTKQRQDDYKLESEGESSEENTKSNGKTENVQMEEGTASNHIQPGSEADYLKEDQKFTQMCKGVTLCVAYAANIGGTATLTGTAPNLVVKGQVDKIFGGEAGLSFSSWFIFAFPNMLISLFISWIWLQIMFLGVRSLGTWKCRTGTDADQAASGVIKAEYAKLGPMRFAEAAVLGHFTLLAVLWITREPEFVPGWSVLFNKGWVTDASTGITIACILFFFPSEPVNFMCCRRSSDKTESKPKPPLLEWDYTAKKLPWGVILMLGGGFALADACKTSGLSKWIGDQFSIFSDFPPWLMVFLICLIVAVFTEVASNTATATIFLPILAELAKTLRVNPLYLMVPTAIATSFAFMLPVATPPNAIVFSSRVLRIKDMVKAGVFMNLICILVLTLAANTWGNAYFKFDQFPSWAGNTTTSGNSSSIGVVNS